MKKIKKYLSMFVCTIFISSLLGVSANADMFVGYDAPHGIVDAQDDGIALASPDDVARFYPHGSYFSVNRSACTCHGESNCPDSNCNCLGYNYFINGGDITDGVGVAYQCAGFAKYCFYRYNGVDVPHFPDASSNQRYITLTENNLYNYLSTIGVHSYLRGKTSNGYAHSVFIAGFTEETVVIWDANINNDCGVRNQTLTYSQFLQRIKKLNWYCDKDGFIEDL